MLYEFTCQCVLLLSRYLSRREDIGRLVRASTVTWRAAPEVCVPDPENWDAHLARPPEP